MRSVWSLSIISLDGPCIAVVNYNVFFFFLGGGGERANIDANKTTEQIMNKFPFNFAIRP